MSTEKISEQGKKFLEIVHKLGEIEEPLSYKQFETIFNTLDCSTEDGNQIFMVLQEEEIAQANLSRETGPLAL